MGSDERKGQVQAQIRNTEESNTNARNQNRMEVFKRKNRTAKIHVPTTHIINLDLGKPIEESPRKKLTLKKS